MIKCSGSGELFSTIRIGSVGGRVGWWLLLVDRRVFGLQRPLTCFWVRGVRFFMRNERHHASNCRDLEGQPNDPSSEGETPLHVLCIQCV